LKINVRKKLPSNSFGVWGTLRFLVIVSLITTALFSADEPAPTYPPGVPGVVVATGVVGQVYLVDSATGQQKPLTEGMNFGQGNSVRTGADGVVSLQFSNGAGLYLYGDSEISVDEYLQRPVAEKKDPKALKEDPSPSFTKLYLKYGEMSAAAKTLKPSSAFELKTANYTAGIRGTIVGAKSQRIGVASDTAKAQAGNIANANALPLQQGQTASELMVHAGIVAVNVNTGLSKVEDHTLIDVESNLSPANTLLTAGQSLKVGSTANATTIVLSNHDVGNISEFAETMSYMVEDFGISTQEAQNAITTATKSKTLTKQIRDISIRRGELDTKNGSGSSVEMSIQDSIDGSTTESRAVVVNRVGQGGLVRSDINNRVVKTSANGNVTTTIVKNDAFVHFDGTFTDSLVAGKTMQSASGEIIYQKSFMASKTGIENRVLTSSTSIKMTEANGSVTDIKEAMYGSLNENGRFDQTVARIVTDSSGKTVVSNTLLDTVDIPRGDQVKRISITGNSTMDIKQSVHKDGTVDTNRVLKTLMPDGKEFKNETNFTNTGKGGFTFEYKEIVGGKVVFERKHIDYAHELLNNGEVSDVVDTHIYDANGNIISFSNVDTLMTEDGQGEITVVTNGKATPPGSKETVNLPVVKNTIGADDISRLPIMVKPGKVISNP
jgi:hypothetical protein